MDGSVGKNEICSSSPQHPASRFKIGNDLAIAIHDYKNNDHVKTAISSYSPPIR